MLLKIREIEHIRDGLVTQAFRRWVRPTVKTGGRLRTALGELAIVRVEICDESALTETDARRAGVGSLVELRRRVAQTDGHLYRIVFGALTADPRVALRGQADLSPDDVAMLQGKLEVLDARAATGPWTLQTLRLIQKKPAVLAATLAKAVGMQRDPFKVNVRKLKELGLTESLEIGYRLSPRGESLLAAIRGRG